MTQQPQEENEVFIILDKSKLDAKSKEALFGPKNVTIFFHDGVVTRVE